MSAAIFLTTNEFLEILISELPEGLYATDFANDDDVSRRSVSSSELRAHASLLGTLSTNLATIYNDKFLSTVTADGIGRYEQDYFSSAQDASMSFALRVQNVISKLRANGGISLPAMTAIVSGVLGGIDFDLLPYSGQAGIGAWVFEGSALDVGTWLSDIDPIMGARTENGLVPLDCSLDYTDEGLTADDLARIQAVAYTYEIRIYSTVSDATISLLDRTLTLLEPAFATHIIRNGQMRPNLINADYIKSYPEFTRLHL